MQGKGLYGKIFANLGLSLFVLLFCIFVLPRLFVFFLPLILAWCIALIASPFVHFLEKKLKIVKKHGSAFMIIIILALVTSFIYLVISFFFHEVQGLLTDLPQIVENISEQLLDSSNTFLGHFGNIPSILSDIVLHWDTFIKNALGNFLDNVDGTSLSKVASVTHNVADWFVLTIFTFIAAYFFTADKDKILKLAVKIIPETIQKHYHTITSQFVTAIVSYFKAQLKIMVIIYAILTIAFGLLSVRYYALIALLTAVLDFLPLFGTGFIIWPWVLFEIFTGKIRQAIFLLLVYLLCQVTKQVLQPKLVGDGIGMSPLATFMFMFIGYRIHGILGLILGIPIGMILYSFYRTGMFDSQIGGIRILIHDLMEYLKEERAT